LFDPRRLSRTALEEGHAELDGLERRLTAELGLWAREAAMIRLRALRASVAGFDNGAELVARADQLIDRARQIDRAEFAPIWERIAAGTYGAEELRAALTATPPQLWHPLVLRILDLHEPPPAEHDRDQQMVAYVATHANSVLELCTQLGPGDRLLDLGSGLGLVVLLVAWLTAAEAHGVEIDPGYVRFAEERGRRFSLQRARFTLGDLRTADLGDPTAVYLFYPARGELLDAILSRVRSLAERRPLRIFSTGPSNAVLAEADWVQPLGVFPSGMTAFGTLEGEVTPRAGRSGARSGPRRRRR
jgi:SAM-dependent methyltransferase